ncbi:MAG: HU family DNA-binding protein [Prevotella sp.]|nr:HU family DNA-binding protein [Prevotella sp.]
MFNIINDAGFRIQYYKVQNQNSKSEFYGKWYGRTHMLGTAGINELAQQIQNRCTVRESDILAVLSELSDAIAGILAQGYQVRVPGLGIFHTTITTERADSKEKFTDDNIKRLNVKFRAERPQTQIGNKTATVLKYCKMPVFAEYTPVKKSKKDTTGGGTSQTGG